jgi:hypothetical protein
MTPVVKDGWNLGTLGAPGKAARWAFPHDYVAATGWIHQD